MALVATLLVLCIFGRHVSAAATWPSSYDELEDIMLLNQGYNAKELSLPVTPCAFPAAPAGFVPAAGFVRTAFHDVAPHNAAAGTGGLDASIGYELSGDHGKENAGPVFNNTLTFLSRYYSPKASMSDLISLALYTAVRGCGGPIISVKTGRVDATGPGDLGVPKVTDSQDTHKNTFSRMGFSTQDMIKLVACGHTLGGVHAPQNPSVIAPGSRAANVANFDNTSTTFDNAVARDFVNNNTVNPLVVGPENIDSDKKVFTADGGLTIKQLADAQTFQNECKIVLQKMLNTVPSNVELTEPIQVYDVKPGLIQLALSDDGKSLTFSGEIRVRTTDRPESSISSVTLSYKDRSGAAGSAITTTKAGTASGYDDVFTFYAFSTTLDAKISISSFDVTVSETDGSSTLFNNNGNSYPVQDTIFVHHPSCSVSTIGSDGQRTIEIIAAARSSAFDISLTVSTQSARDVPIPLLTTQSIPVSTQSTIGDYTFYKGTFEIAPEQINSTSFDLSCTSNGQKFNVEFSKLFGFGGSPLPSNSSTSSSTSSYTSTATTSRYGWSSSSTTSTSTATSSYGQGWNGTTTTTTYTLISHPTSSSSKSNPTSTTTPTTSSSPTEATDDYLHWSPAPSPPSQPSTRPCGEFEGCDAQPWAQNPSWAVPLPGPNDYTVPGGAAPGSATPVWGQDTNLATSGTAAAYTWATWSATPTSTVEHAAGAGAGVAETSKEASGSASVSGTGPPIAAFTGAAGRARDVSTGLWSAGAVGVGVAAILF